MELEIAPRCFAILPLCLAVALSALGCGDDPATTDDGASPSTADNDAGAKAPAKADAGATPTSPTPGNKPDAASSKPDVGAGNAGASNPSGESGNTIYTGGPECPTIGQKMGGTIEGKPVAYNLASLSKTTDTTFEADESGVDRGLIDIEWEPALTPGKTSKIINGELTLPTMYELGPYCVIDGQVQADATLDPKMGDRIYATITKVKKQVKSKCEGDEIVADLKLCSLKP